MQTVRAVARGSNPDEKLVEFYLEQDGDEVNLMADAGGFDWFVLTIKPDSDGLNFRRHTDVPEDFFDVDDELRIREAQQDSL